MFANHHVYYHHQPPNYPLLLNGCCLEVIASEDKNRHIQLTIVVYGWDAQTVVDLLTIPYY